MGVDCGVGGRGGVVGVVGVRKERGMSERLSPEDRYRSDPQFKVLVDILEAAVQRAEYTPTELREAAMLAAIHYESYRVHRPFIAPREASHD